MASPHKPGTSSHLRRDNELYEATISKLKDAHTTNIEEQHKIYVLLSETIEKSLMEKKACIANLEKEVASAKADRDAMAQEANSVIAANDGLQRNCDELVATI